MSPGEEEAERLYTLLQEGRMSKKGLAWHTIILARHSPLGVEYLWFLLNYRALGNGTANSAGTREEGHV